MRLFRQYLVHAGHQQKVHKHQRHGHYLHVVPVIELGIEEMLVQINNN